jgi:hypothetical protein
MAVALAQMPAIYVPHTFRSSAVPIEETRRPVLPHTCRSRHPSVLAQLGAACIRVWSENEAFRT